MTYLTYFEGLGSAFANSWGRECAGKRTLCNGVLFQDCLVTVVDEMYLTGMTASASLLE